MVWVYNSVSMSQPQNYTRTSICMNEKWNIVNCDIQEESKQWKKHKWLSLSRSGKLQHLL